VSQFENVTVVKQANVYFDGKATSRTVLFANGTRKTLGIMLPGEYEFAASEQEVMEVLAGAVDVLLLGESEWRHFDGTGTFVVPANTRFQLKVRRVLDYCCSYGKV